MSIVLFTLFFYAEHSIQIGHNITDMTAMKGWDGGKIVVESIYLLYTIDYLKKIYETVLCREGKGETI